MNINHRQKVEQLDFITPAIPALNNMTYTYISKKAFRLSDIQPKNNV
jgi:hypothetical protein